MAAPLSAQVLNFDTFPLDPDGPGGFAAGNAIPNNYVLNNAYLGLGVALTSTFSGGNVIALNIPAIAVSGSNVALGLPDNPSGIVFTFQDLLSGLPGVTNFFSLASDADASAEQWIMTAFDLSGVLLATTGVVNETTSVTRSFNVAGIHSVVFQPIVGNPGIAIDNVQFNPVTVVPETVNLLSVGAGVVAVLGVFARRRRAVA